MCILTRFLADFCEKQVEIRALVRSMPLDRALSAVLPLGSDDKEPCSGIFDMSDLAVDLAMTRASPIIGALLKRRINSHRARMLASAASQQVNEGKFSFSLVGGNMDDFKAGVTGRVGEPRDDLEKGTLLMCQVLSRSRNTLTSLASANLLFLPPDPLPSSSQAWRLSTLAKPTLTFRLDRATMAY